MTGPVVLTVSVAVRAEEPVRVATNGEMLQLTPENPVSQDRFIVPLNPFIGVMVTIDVPDCPAAATVMVAGFAVKE